MFIDDKEKMHDFNCMTKSEFLASYSYLTEQEYDDTQTHYLTQLIGYIQEGKIDGIEVERIVSNLSLSWGEIHLIEGELNQVGDSMYEDDTE